MTDPLGINPEIQYAVTPVPAHTHNNTDSLPVDISNIARFVSAPTSGDMAYWNGSSWVALHLGTTGTVITSSGTSPTYTNALATRTTVYDLGVTSQAADDATTMVIPHSVGTNPTYVRMSVFCGATATIPARRTVIGSYNHTKQSCIWTGVDAGGNPTYGQNGTYIVYIQTNSAGSITSWAATATTSATSITLTITKTGATSSDTANFFWEAWG